MQIKDTFLALIAVIVAMLSAKYSPEFAGFILAASLAIVWLEAYSTGEDWKRVMPLLLYPAQGEVRKGLLPPRSMYENLLNAVLNWFDKRLNPEVTPVPEGGDPLTLRRAWGWRIYDRCLLLSLAYPLVFVLVAWMFSPGEAGVIGRFEVLPAETSQLGRIGIVLSLGLLSIYLFKLNSIMARLQSVFESFAVGPNLAEWLAVAFAVAGAVAVAFAGAVAVAVAFAVAVAVAVAGAVAGAVAVAVAFAGAVAVAFAVAVAVAFAVAGAVAVAFAVAGAFAFAVWVGFEWLHGKRPALAYALLMPLVAAVYAASLHWGTLNQNATSLIVFVGLLPLVNAQFDFLSITATRHLLRRGLASGPVGQIGWGAFDLFVGGVLFLALCLTAVAVAHVANVLAGQSVVDLAAVFAEPKAHYWLFAAFLTTLLPTFLHGVLFLLSFLVLWPQSIRHWCAVKLHAFHTVGDSAGDAMTARLTIALMAGAACALTVFAFRLGWMALGHLHLAGAFILDACSGWHDVLQGWAPVA